MLGMESVHWEFELYFPAHSNTWEDLEHSEDASKAGKQGEDLTAREVG